MFFSLSIIHKAELKQTQASLKLFYNSHTYLQQLYQSSQFHRQFYQQSYQQLYQSSALPAQTALYQSISSSQPAINLTTEAVINLAVELSESSSSSELSALFTSCTQSVLIYFQRVS